MEKQTTTNLIENTGKVLISLKKHNDFVEDTFAYITRYCKQLLGVENIEFKGIEKESKESDCIVAITKIEVVENDLDVLENEIDEIEELGIEPVEELTLEESYILSQVLTELEDLLKQLLGDIWYGKTKMGDINKYHFYLFNENEEVYETIKEKLENKRLLISGLYESYLFQNYTLEEQLEELVYCVHDTNRPRWNF